MQMKDGGRGSQEIGECASLRLQMENLVGSVIGGRTAQKLFEEFVKVTGIVETNRYGKVCDGGEVLLGIHQFFGRFIDSVFH